MRDMDLLLRTAEIDRARELLLHSGFHQSTVPISHDHYHLPSLHKTVDGVEICIELHHGLYPKVPPYYPRVDFEKLLVTAKPFIVAGVAACTFGPVEMLDHLYLHGFRAPLTYETYKLINAADLISFIEQNFISLDWSRIGRKSPRMVRALPLLHHISPWDFTKVPESFVPKRVRQRRIEPKPFIGWPQRRFKAFKGRARLRDVLRETFLPSSWWLRMYYGGRSLWDILVARSVLHPWNVLWWVHVYSHFVVETRPEPVGRTKGKMGAVWFRMVSTGNKVLGVIRKLKEI